MVFSQKFLDQSRNIISQYFHWLFLKQGLRRRHFIYYDFSFQPEPIRMVFLVALTDLKKRLLYVFHLSQIFVIIADYLRLGYLV